MDVVAEVPVIAAEMRGTDERGAYLATVANGRGCHTVHGGGPDATLGHAELAAVLGGALSA